MSNGAPAFEPLARLFHGDRAKIRRTLEVFYRVTQGDLQQLDSACEELDWTRVAALMHKTKSACLQIGENAAAEAAQAMEAALQSGMDQRHRAFQSVRSELGRVQQRIARYLATEN